MKPTHSLHGILTIAQNQCSGPSLKQTHQRKLCRQEISFNLELREAWNSPLRVKSLHNESANRNWMIHNNLNDGH